MANGFPPNVKYFKTFSLICVLANWSYRCPQHLYPPDGMLLIIGSHPNNPIGSLVLVSTNQFDATSADAWPLIPGATVSYQIIDAYEVWVSATVAGCIALFSAEQGIT